MNRRHFVSCATFAGLSGLSALAGCGFKLRGNLRFAFESIAVTPQTGSAVAVELRRALDGNVKVLELRPLPGTGSVQPQVVLDVLTEQREKTVVGVNAAGQVREFQLRIRVKFRLRTPEGRELIADTELLQQRDISFNESAVLAKEAEENLLYNNMQTDIVQQLMRRLAAATLN